MMPLRACQGHFGGGAGRARPLLSAAARRRQSLEAYSDLIVPFGRMVETDDFCTVISVPSAISTPT